MVELQPGNVIYVTRSTVLFAHPRLDAVTVKPSDHFCVVSVERGNNYADIALLDQRGQIVSDVYHRSLIVELFKRVDGKRL